MNVWTQKIDQLIYLWYRNHYKADCEYRKQIYKSIFYVEGKIIKLFLWLKAFKACGGRHEQTFKNYEQLIKM